MKFIFSFSLLLLLVSCGVDKAENTVNPQKKVVAEDISVAPVEEKQDSPIDTEETSSEKELEVASQQSVDDMNTAIDDIAQEEEKGGEQNSILQKITTTYKNPKQTVNVAIEYTLDSQGTVESLKVSSDNYNLEKFNTSIQNQVIGKKKENINVYVAGESLASDAFNAALK